MRLRPLTPLIMTLALAGAMFTASCATTPPADDPLSQPAGGPPVSLVVANSDLAVGQNRVSFGLVDREYMPVRPDAVQLRAVYYEPGAPTGQVRDTSEAEFLPWPPDGRRGTYIAEVSFDQAGTATGETPGIWELHATFDYSEGETLTIGSTVSVASKHKAPAVGAPAPLTETPRADDVSDLSAISSSPEPDPALYQISLAEAVRSGKPTLVSFATPAFCVSATCGPQITDLSALAAKYGDQANIIHVEVYKDPHLIDPSNPVRELVPAVEQWGLVTEPWTFVIAADGTVSHRFEQYAPPAVLEPALLAEIQLK